MYQVKMVQTITDKQMDAMVSAIRAFVGDYSREKLHLNFNSIENWESAQTFYNFVLKQALFSDESTRGRRT